MIVHERGCVYNFNFHLVFVTKYRKEVFDSPEKVEEMKGLLQKRADMSDIQIQEMEVMLPRSRNWLSRTGQCWTKASCQLEPCPRLKR